MYYAPQMLLCCLLCIRAFKSSVAKEPLDPELLRKFTKDVETVLSPTLIEELQGTRSNRSAINVAQTVPRNPEQPRIVDDRKPEIQFDNNVYPYHYERSYHYHYPPSPQDDASGPATYSENFYEPRFRPRSQPIESRDPSYYRSELYDPFVDPSSTTNDHSFRNSDLHGSLYPNDKQRKENRGGRGKGIQIPNGYSPSEVLDGSTSAPPSSFAPSHSNPFPNTDYGGYRHGVFAGSAGSSDNFRPTESVTQHQSDSHSGRYLPQNEGGFSESFHRIPVESYRNFQPLEVHGYNEQHRSLLPENSPRKAHYLPPPFLGSSFPQGYQNHFQNNYHPSEAFNGLFSENFTRDFPSKPAFGGFHNSHNYPVPPTSSAPSTSTSPTLSASSNSENPVPPGGPSSQPIPTTKPNDKAPIPLASNINYETNLFLPAKDDVNKNFQPTGPEKFPLKNFK